MNEQRDDPFKSVLVVVVVGQRQVERKRQQANGQNQAGEAQLPGHQRVGVVWFSRVPQARREQQLGEVREREVEDDADSPLQSHRVTGGAERDHVQNEADRGDNARSKHPVVPGTQGVEPCRDPGPAHQPVDRQQDCSGDHEPLEQIEPRAAAPGRTDRAAAVPVRHAPRHMALECRDQIDAVDREDRQQASQERNNRCGVGDRTRARHGYLILSRSTMRMGVPSACSSMNRTSTCVFDQPYLCRT